MAFTQITLSALITEISLALQDTSNVYWVADEIQGVIYEALLHWGGLTSYWRERGLYNTTANSPFYDLSVKLPLLRARTYTLGQIVKDIQYALLESPSGVAGSDMTTQFTISQITDAVIRARNQFVNDTRIPITYINTLPVIPPTVNSVDLPDYVALVSSGYWEDSNGAISPIRREDDYAIQASNLQWILDPGTPIVYSTSDTGPTQLILSPPPLSLGNLSLICCKTIDVATADAAPLALPDEFVHALKYYALYLILSTYAPGQDALRSKYCFDRYTSYAEAAKAHRSVLRVRVNNRPLQLDTIASLDNSAPFWRSTVSTPYSAAAAYDLVALYPVADSSNYSVSVDVVRSAPIPALSDYVQVGKEDLVYIMDYCRHVLSFKMGGEEFLTTFPLYDNFMSGVSQQGGFLSAAIKYLSPLYGVPKSQEAVAPSA